MYGDSFAAQAAGCPSCAQPCYTQYVRPHARFDYSDHVNPYPAGPCCRTVFGELLCDIGHHLRRVVYCQDDILATGCDGCEVGSRIHWTVYRVCGIWFLGRGSPLRLDPAGRVVRCAPWMAATWVASPGSRAARPWLRQGSHLRASRPRLPSRMSRAKSRTFPTRPSPPVQSARLRAILTPPGLTAPDPYVRRSQYTQPLRGQGVGWAVRRATIAKGPRQAGRPAATAAKSAAVRPVTGRQSSEARGKTAVATPLQSPAPPARTIRFADQYGKSAKTPPIQRAFR